MDSFAHVLEALKNSHASIGCPHSVLVGLSGGADSVALLLSLCSLREELSLSMTAIHVNHGLRENAAADEAFCKKMCAELNVPLVVEHVDVSQRGSLEAAARTARYAAFDKVLQTTRADVLALAHHMDDQAETVLMHLLYGAGAAGLAGMQEKNQSVWRPFLHLRRAEIQDFVISQGYTWCEDETNSDVAFTRNRIRTCILPEMEACAPEAVSAIGRTAQILQTENDYLQGLADVWLKKYASKSAYPFLLVQPLREEHLAMQRRILRRYCDMLHVGVDYAQTERLRMLLARLPGSVENLPEGWQAFKSKEKMHFLKGKSIKPESVGKLLFDKKCIAVDGRCQQRLPAEQMQGLELRTRKTGDFIQPFGMQGTKPLKEYMIDRGVDRPFRDGWPLVCRGSEVLWVIGIGASEKLRVGSNDTDTIRMTYSGELPDRI